MSYTPINWQTGDTITAEKLNKMDNGWSISDVQLFSETVTMTDDGDYHYAVPTYSSPINYDYIKVIFDGTEYVCPMTFANSTYNYGGVYDFSEYPFYIYSYLGGNGISTQTGGTHSIVVVAPNAEVSDKFKRAVAKTDTSFQIVPGQTIFRDAFEAFNAGKDVYVLEFDQNNGVIDKTIILMASAWSYNLYGIKMVSNGEYPAGVILSASSDNGVINSNS